MAAQEDRQAHPQLLHGCHLVEPSLNDATVAAIERRLKQRRIAAFILEPISIGLGVRRPPLEALRRIVRACRRQGTLIIADEVACGFGRTGKLFASEWLALKPDILCLAKALGGGHAPIGAAVMTASVARSLEAKGSFYSTFGWHPLGIEAALANLEFMIAHHDTLLGNVLSLGDYFDRRLDAMPFKNVKQIRAVGLAVAVEFTTSGPVEDLISQCRKKGLLVTTADDNTLLLVPPLTISRPLAKRGLDILQSCVR